MKRKRYTATLASPDGLLAQKVVLAYSPRNATDYFESLGWTVKSIALGDFRRRFRPPTGARPDTAAIRQAIEFMGLVLPVKIHSSGRQGGSHGLHRTSQDQHADPCHVIMVKDWLSADEMGRTIWHELAHAWQFERDYYDPSRPFRALQLEWNQAYRDGNSYRSKPAEREARNFEDFNDEQPLAR